MWTMHAWASKGKKMLPISTKVILLSIQIELPWIIFVFDFVTHGLLFITFFLHSQIGLISVLFLPVTELSRLSMLQPEVSSRSRKGLVISIASSSISSSSSSSGMSASKSDINVPETYPNGGAGVWGG